MEKDPMHPGFAYDPEEYEWPDDARTPMTETEAGQSRMAGGAKNAKNAQSAGNAKNAKNGKTENKAGTEGGVCKTKTGAKNTYVVNGRDDAEAQGEDCGGKGCGGKGCGGKDCR